ncbi:MAG: hypothetical protein JOZ97_08815 [Candidatus Eremiobacteraeota bacterium]|nr:hypothetical protein [Candidatus Eremiobacteraeota bacterium]
MRSVKRVMPILFVALLLGVAPPPSRNKLIAQRIHHVFVIYEENRSFDNLFGTFPGANGVWSNAARTHGFYQRVTPASPVVTPFKITDPDVYYENNARAVLNAAINGGQMDSFVATQAAALKVGTEAQRASVGAEAMYHLDCDTIPLTWAFAKRFALFDNFFQALRSPSTPSNIEIIAAQNGLTQYARHPNLLPPQVTLPGDPVFADLDPQFGPYESQPKTVQIDQTYANILLMLQRGSVGAVRSDANDIQQDKAFIARLGASAIPWRWYEEGYAEPHTGLIAHHVAPQYFGYVVNNDIMRGQIRDLTTFYTDLASGALPARGLFYLKGGSHNTLGLHPANKDPAVQRAFDGDDDHPGYTDQQISEAFVASLVSAIARSRYWRDSAIVITWDDSGGYWDHVSPHDFERCPDGYPCGDGERVPAIVISPFARSSAIVHSLSDQDSVLKFVESVFNVPPLASLPDEKPFLPLGPRDGNALISNLADAFDTDRLSGKRALVPASHAVFDQRTILTIPPPVTCANIGVTPLPPPAGVSDAPPAWFNPRPFESTASKLRAITYDPAQD